MQSIKRTTVLLKPCSSLYRNAAVLRLQETKHGIALSLDATSLNVGHFEHYLFLRENKLLYAGNLKSGRLFTTLYDIALKDIEGGAVVDSENNSLCLKSANIDRYHALERLRFGRKRSVKEPINFVSALQQDPGEMPMPQVAPADNRREPARLSVEAQKPLPFDPPPVNAYQPAPYEPPIQQVPQEPIPYEPSTFSEMQNAATYEPIPKVPTPSENPPHQACEPTDSACDYDAGNAPDVCESCPSSAIRQDISPFTGVFAHSKWVRISYPGPGGQWHYLSGEITEPGSAAKALGVPGQYAVSAPTWLEGFDTYLVSNEAQGYWLRFWNPETGEAVHPALSPHGA